MFQSAALYMKLSSVHVHPQHTYVSIGKQVADSISTYLCVGFNRNFFSFIVVESCSRVSIPSVKFLFVFHKRTSFIFAHAFVRLMIEKLGAFEL